MKVSIIVPFKNAAQYAASIVESFETQDYNSFEVIFVDDASEDASGELISSLVTNFNFRVVRGKGNGPGSARNYGMSLAVGEYIGFVDVDDYLDISYISKLIEKAKGADIVECMYKAISPTGDVISSTNVESFLSSADRFSETLLGKHSRVSWGKLYRKNFLQENKISFPDGIYTSEDHIFVLKCFKYSSTLTIVPEFLYFWLRRPDSLTNKTPTKKNIEDFCCVAQIKFELLNDGKSDSLYEGFSKRLLKEIRIFRREIEGNSVLESIFRKTLKRNKNLTDCAEFIAKQNLYMDVVEFLNNEI